VCYILLIGGSIKSFEIITYGSNGLKAGVSVMQYSSSPKELIIPAPYAFFLPEESRHMPNSTVYQ
jgi:hypothetical protein